MSKIRQFEFTVRIRVLETSETKARDLLESQMHNTMMGDHPLDSPHIDYFKEVNCKELDISKRLNPRLGWESV